MKKARSLADLLLLQKVCDGEYLCNCHEPNVNEVLFGGQLFAQVALASSLDCPADRTISSFQLAFARPARADQALRFHVTNLGDLANFSSRHVLATQNGQSIISANVTLQRRPVTSAIVRVPVSGNVPVPEELPDAEVLLREQGAHFEHHMALQLARDGLARVRLIKPESYLYERKADSSLSFWLQPRFPLPSHANPQAAIAYMSDVWHVYAALVPHVAFDQIGLFRIGTINHALWYYSDWVLNDWVLVHAHSPIADRSCGLVQTGIYSRDGRVIALTSSEAVYRAATPNYPSLANTGGSVT